MDKVVLDKPVREQVQVRIVWRGGDHTTLTYGADLFGRTGVDAEFLRRLAVENGGRAVLVPEVK